MNVKYENRHFKFQEKENTVFIDFCTEFFPSPHEYKDRRVTYCTISVYDENKAVKHYHAGTVYNPHDHYNQRSGMFIAFRKALRERWFEDAVFLYDVTWEQYHEKWSHYLAALMDKKVSDEQPYDPNPF